jgi:hypothetical protein
VEEVTEGSNALENTFFGSTGLEAPREPTDTEVKQSSSPLRQRKPETGDYSGVLPVSGPSGFLSLRILIFPPGGLMAALT